MLIPQPIQELSLHLGLWGFIVPVTQAVSLRAFPNLLLLRPGSVASQRIAIVCYIIGVIVVTATWLAQGLSMATVETAASPRAAGWIAMTFGGALLMWSLRVYEPPARSSQAPHITEPTRLWFGLAVGISPRCVACKRVLLDARGAQWLLGHRAGDERSPSCTVNGLSHAVDHRHGRTNLPGAIGRYDASAERAGSADVAMAGGAGLRVAGELWTGYVGPGAILMGSGATLAFVSYAWFSIRLWASIGRRQPVTYGL